MVNRNHWDYYSYHTWYILQSRQVYEYIYLRCMDVSSVRQHLLNFPDLAVAFVPGSAVDHFLEVGRIWQETLQEMSTYVPTRCTYLYKYYHVPGRHEGLVLESFVGTTAIFLNTVTHYRNIHVDVCNDREENTSIFLYFEVYGMRRRSDKCNNALNR